MRIKLLLWLACALLVASCCTISFKGVDVGNAATFSVDFFENRASLVNPNLSQVFTEGLKDKFLRETRLELLTQEKGQLHFTGYISGYTVSPAAIQGDDQARAMRLTITVNVKFENALDPKKNFEQNFSNFADFDGTRNLSDVETELVNAIVQGLTNDIFNRALINW